VQRTQGVQQQESVLRELDTWGKDQGIIDYYSPASLKVSVKVVTVMAMPVTGFIPV